MLNLKLNPNYDEKPLNEAKSKLDKIFAPNSRTRIPDNFTLSAIKSAIKDFKNICNDEKLVAQVQLYFVENAIDFSNTFGDMDESYSNTLSFSSAANVLGNDDKLYNDFFSQMEDLCNKVEFGWYVQENMEEILAGIRRC